MFGFLKKKSDSKDAPKSRKGSNGFYMELDESKASASENGKQPAESAVKVETAPAPAAATAPAAEPAKATKPETKSKRAKALEKSAAPAAAPAAATAKPAAPAAATNGKVQPETIKTFAPDYLLTLTSTNGRRRPGANMSSYLEMARQMKTR